MKDIDLEILNHIGNYRIPMFEFWTEDSLPDVRQGIVDVLLTIRIDARHEGTGIANLCYDAHW